jgi:hypothetical protein
MISSLLHNIVNMYYNVNITTEHEKEFKKQRDTGQGSTSFSKNVTNIIYNIN